MTREEAIFRILDHERIHSKKEPFTPYLDEAFAMAIEALREQRPHGEWIPCSERLPETEKKVLVNLHNTYGKDVILMASHIGYHERTSEDYGWREYEGDTEYDEENDCFWIPECWYESNYVEDNVNWIIGECEGEITHWTPLPEPYKEEGEEV